MVGSYVDAVTAREAFVHGHGPLPYADYGCSRMVYLINDVIYKVERDAQAKGVNEMEWVNMTTGSLPSGVFYPEVSLFEVMGEQVIAMECITGNLVADCNCIEGEECDDMCMSDEVKALVSPYLDDTCGFNVVINSEGIWIIDAG